MRLVGYSLGGGIAIHFATSFPHMIESLVLLAPAGLIRAENFGRINRFIFQSGLIPERILEAFTRRRLRHPLANSVVKPAAVAAAAVPAAVPADLAGERGRPHEHLESYLDVLTAAAPDLENEVLRCTAWMVDHHAGFVPAFMSSIRYAPLTDQHAAWSRLADREPGTTLILLGETDELVDLEDYLEDAIPLVGGKEKVKWRTIGGGGHNFPMSHAKDVIRELYEFWGRGDLC